MESIYPKVDWKVAFILSDRREENIACDLNDTAWFEKIDAADGAVFFAAGVFYYSGLRRCRKECGKADAENMD